MGIYKGVAEAAARADEQLATFKKMIAKKEAQLAASKKPEGSRHIRVKIRPRSQG